MQQTEVPPRPGLRERKKAKTRLAIQEHALRLFRQKGYDGTTVEEIADAAEVSLDGRVPITPHVRRIRRLSWSS